MYSIWNNKIWIFKKTFLCVQSYVDKLQEESLPIEERQGKQIKMNYLCIHIYRMLYADIQKN